MVELPKTWKELQDAFKDKLLDNYPVLLWDNITATTRDLLIDSVQNCPQNSKSRATPDTPGLQDYALAAERLRALTGLFKSLKEKHHLIAIMHERTDKDDVTGGMNFLPSAPGQSPAHVLSLFTEIIYLAKDSQGKRTAYMSPHPKGWPAATRLLNVDKMEVPNGQTFLTDAYSKQTWINAPIAQVLGIGQPS